MCGFDSHHSNNNSDTITHTLLPLPTGYYYRQESQNYCFRALAHTRWLRKKLKFFYIGCKDEDEEQIIHYLLYLVWHRTCVHKDKLKKFHTFIKQLGWLTGTKYDVIIRILITVEFL